jgi:hypothetical protein
MQETQITERDRMDSKFFIVWKKKNSHNIEDGRGEKPVDEKISDALITDLNKKCPLHHHWKELSI